MKRMDSMQTMEAMQFHVSKTLNSMVSMCAAASRSRINRRRDYTSPNRWQRDNSRNRAFAVDNLR
jgi:hypothetical protein